MFICRHFGCLTGEGWDESRNGGVGKGRDLTAVKREKFAKNKKTTSKERFSLLLSNVDTLPVSCRFTNFFGTLLKKF